MQAEELARRIDQGSGRMAADLVLRDARILNTATGAIDPPADIASAARPSSARRRATAARA